MSAPFLTETKDGVCLAIKLQPRASRQQIGGLHGSELKVSVTAPPVDSAANQALVEFIAELLDLPRSKVELVRGQTSRHKTILLRSVSSAVVLEKIQCHLD
jgi:uncharacterized protein (TIGR00251 family)